MTGATDSRHYLDITANGVYRFFPLFVNLTAGDVTRIHGIDERIKVYLFIFIRCITADKPDRLVVLMGPNLRIHRDFSRLGQSRLSVCAMKLQLLGLGSKQPIAQA